MAQSVEHIVHIDGVVGSSPTGTTTTSLRGLVFCYICKNSVRSIWERTFSYFFHSTKEVSP